LGDGAALIRRRLEIRQAEWTIASDTARLGAVAADLYPQISIKNFGPGAAFDFSLGLLLN